jgi:lipoprotein-anchoring transpeptidase ErfK/SrfK
MVPAQILWVTQGEVLKYRLRFIIFVLPVVSFLLVLFFYQRDEPPVSTLTNARAALDRAAHARAFRYADSTFTAAEKAVKDGQMEMARQNGRLALLRDYSHAGALISQGLGLALQSQGEAERRVHSLDSLSRDQYARFESELKLCRDALDGKLINFSAERYWATADISLKTSWLLISSGEYDEAVENIEKGKTALRQLVEALAEAANNEKGNVGIWRAWVAETVAQSAGNSNHAVIVDKTAHKAYLIEGGKLVRTYRCDLGWNSAEQKYFQGDGATPEGKYKITSVKRKSKYYRALLLDYPNDLDQRRFAENKRKRLISKYARIGALIEIHGSGGRGEDWTDGCVALKNGDMDHLMRYVGVGTPVTIVRRSDRWP